MGMGTGGLQVIVAALRHDVKPAEPFLEGGSSVARSPKRCPAALLLWRGTRCDFAPGVALAPSKPVIYKGDLNMSMIFKVQIHKVRERDVTDLSNLNDIMTRKI
jgi:hypothetical protein